MTQVYHIQMDDGHRLDLRADSAANAVASALKQHLGHRVTRCFLGGMENYQGMELVKVWSNQAVRMEFEIPPHEPLTAPPPVRHRDRAPAELFNDDEILRESHLAKSKRNTP